MYIPATRIVAGLLPRESLELSGMNWRIPNQSDASVGQYSFPVRDPYSEYT